MAYQGQNIENVVELFGDEDANARRRASDIVMHAKATSRELLLAALTEMFDGVDDFLFGLADKAETNRMQSLYFDVMRIVRLRKTEMTKAFEHRFDASVIDVFTDHLSEPGSTRHTEEDANDSLSLSLDLVKNDELEESLAITNMESKACKLYRDDLFALAQRFNALCKSDRFNETYNPLAPNLICDAFQHAVSKLEVDDIELKIIIYKLFDRVVISKLRGVYAAVNEEFVAAGVLPKISVSIVRNDARQSASDGLVDDMWLDNSETEHVPDDTLSLPPSAERKPTGWSFEALCQMLGRKRAATQEVAAPLTDGGAQPSERKVAQTGGAAPQHYETAQLLTVLSDLQRRHAELPNVALPDGQPSVSRIDVVDHLRETKSGRSAEISQVDADTIDIVGFMFDFLVEDPHISDRLRSCLLQLQIPVIKVAVLDKTFFSKKAHAARRLLNELARAASTVADEDENAPNSLFSKITEIVTTIANEFADDVSLFDSLLEDFEAHLASNAEQEKKARERLEEEKHHIKNALEAKLGDAKLPKFVESFLLGPWYDVLSRIYNNEGEGSQTWNAALDTVDNLVWSLQPKTESTERQLLIVMIPQLVREIEDGLTFIDFDEGMRARFFTALEPIHLRCLEGRKFVPDNSAGSTQETAHANASGFEEIVIGMAATEDDKVSYQALEDAKQRVRRLPLETWVSFEFEDGTRKRGKLIWKDEDFGEYTFVNWCYQVVADKRLRELASDFAFGRAQVLPEAPFFDRAMETVMRKLGSRLGDSASPA